MNGTAASSSPGAHPLFELAPGAGGTVFRVRVSPGASRSHVTGVHAGALKVRVSAPPERGKANAALLKLLAGALGVKQRSLRIVSGEAARDKRILLEGVSGEETEKLLRRAAGVKGASASS